MEGPSPKPRAKHLRSLVKAITWRGVGIIDTFVWTAVVTGKVSTAGAVSLTETFTKVPLYYLHERAWNWVPWDHRSHRRAWAKAITWRVIGTLDTFVISILMTGSVANAGSIATWATLTQIITYYIHERLWNRVPWGRKQAEEEAAARAQAREAAATARAQAKAAE